VPDRRLPDELGHPREPIVSKNECNRILSRWCEPIGQKRRERGLFAATAPDKLPRPRLATGAVYFDKPQPKEPSSVTSIR